MTVIHRQNDEGDTNQKWQKSCRFCYNTTQESEVRLWQLSIRKNN